MPTKTIRFNVAPAVTQTALATLAASLAPGAASRALGDTGMNGANTENGQVVFWQSRWHFDGPRRRGLFLGKEQQNTGGTARFHSYDELTNQWNSAIPTWGTGSETGHTYDSNAYDYERGEHYYQRHNDSRRIRRWQQNYTLDRWDDLAIDFSPLNPITGNNLGINSTGETGQAWHPNLFGPGDGGLVIVCYRGIGAWRRSTNTCSVLASFSVSGTVDVPCCEYVAGLNAVIVSIGNDLRTWRVNAGPTVTAVANAPLKVGCINDNAGARFVDDPLGRPFAWALEVNNAAGNRVWRWDGTSFVLQPHTHPFGQGNQNGNQAATVVAAVRPYGVIWALERFNNSLRSHIWKPPV